MALETGPGNESIFYPLKNLKFSIMKEIFTTVSSTLCVISLSQTFLSCLKVNLINVLRAKSEHFSLRLIKLIIVFAPSLCEREFLF